MDNPGPLTLDPAADKRSQPPWLLMVVMTTAVSCPLLAAWAVVRFGSVGRAYEYASGKRLFADQPARDFGAEAPGRRIPVAFGLKNLGSEPIRVVGFNAGCIGHPADDIPFRMRPGESRLLRMELRLPQVTRSLTIPVILHTNIPEQPEVRLLVTGEVIDAKSPHERQEAVPGSRRSSFDKGPPK